MRCLFACCLLLLGLSSCRKDLIHYQSVAHIYTETGNRLNRILFVNDTLGFVCGGDRFNASDILITRDGGGSWWHYSAPAANKELFGIAQSPDGSVYFIGFDGNMLRTPDGGRTWRHFQLRYEAYKALAFSDAAHMQVVGGVSFERGDAMYVDTTGSILAYDSLGYELNDISLLSNGAGWRCGYGVMQRTDDAGKTWQWQGLRNDNYTSLDVHDAQTAYACGAEGSICVTRDGRTWQTLRNGNDLTYPKYRLQDLLFTDDQHGYAVGEKGVVIYTDDAGQHWSELKRFTEANLHGIARGPNGVFFVCGEGGALWEIRF